MLPATSIAIPGRPLELLSQPLARLLAAVGQSANLYLFARKR